MSAEPSAAELSEFRAQVRDVDVAVLVARHGHRRKVGDRVVRQLAIDVRVKSNYRRWGQQHRLAVSRQGFERVKNEPTSSARFVVDRRHAGIVANELACDPSCGNII